MKILPSFDFMLNLCKFLVTLLKFCVSFPENFGKIFENYKTILMKFIKIHRYFGRVSERINFSITLLKI